MFGFSIFLHEDLTKETKDYFNSMVDIGFEGVFTSLHLPEDDISKYSARLNALLEMVQRRKVKLMIDISGNALEHIGLSLDDPATIFESGISGLRMDDGIEMESIAKLSHYITVGLNASTLTENDYEQLLQYQAEFSNIEVWHNYYPRPDTGLDEEWFREKNMWLKNKQLKVSAFVPGDSNLRLPLYETLPTLEIHRYENPFSSSLSLKRDYLVDDVYIGDPGISHAVCKQFEAYLQQGMLLLHGNARNEKWDAYIYKRHQNRLDVSKHVIRSEQSRMTHKNEEIQPEHTVERNRGSITIDNNLYKRYKGEVQIIKQERLPDQRVNVIGQVIDKDLPLLDFIQDGTKFKINKPEEGQHELR
ncbi:DUF871 domain-containing protein [Virgibacillus halophilus]|uniref:MupG family TIM beta-alpha barrel fold protein n=1 Tax=Tigheibacillus halophilus TaxID=361280 RepID=A0ABU5C359_9BACI|nr:MupG family TIM beta-alpha barrel fold protein [Virgibacillus halophilus]